MLPKYLVVSNLDILRQQDDLSEGQQQLLQLGGKNKFQSIPVISLKHSELPHSKLWGINEID